MRGPVPVHQPRPEARTSNDSEGKLNMIRLYRSATHPRQWLAYVPGTGWLAFPNKEHGWLERKPARGLDPMHLREVPAQFATHTGIFEEEPELAEAS